MTTVGDVVITWRTPAVISVSASVRDGGGVNSSSTATPASPPDDFDCVDCGADTFALDEYYMVHDHLWMVVGMPLHGGGMLCVGCFEGRLGRRLAWQDFTDCPVNRLPFWPKSERLDSRLLRPPAVVMEVGVHQGQLWDDQAAV